MADTQDKLAIDGRPPVGRGFAHPGATGLGDEFDRLRLRLTPAEGDRFRALGRACGRAMSAAIHGVRPGMTEAGALTNTPDRPTIATPLRQTDSQLILY
jgi:hypothetical protein